MKLPYLPALALLAALALAAPHTAHAAHAQPYFVTDLTPGGFTEAAAFAAYFNGNAQFNAQAGYVRGPATEDNPHAFLWYGTPGSGVDLNPSGYASSYALGVAGNTVVGYGQNEGGGDPHALLWYGTAKSAIDLNPAGFDFSRATALYSQTQVGYGDTTNTGNSVHALLWHGTAKSAVDLNPKGFSKSFALGVNFDTQVGYGSGPATGGLKHALLWKGHAATAVDLNPPRYNQSQANAVSVDTGGGYVSTEAGFASNGDNQQRAFLWHKKDPNGINLHPAGYRVSAINALYQNTQAGYGISAETGVSHALVWHGTRDSVIDLNAALPAGFTSATATGVDSNGDISGYAVGPDNIPHALLWRPNRTGPPVISRLSTDVVDMGSPAFTLIVYGTKLVPSTVVRWNGRTLATTYVRAHLTAVVPAALVASPGTADITVQTPNVATSGATPFHIRPLLTSVSPSAANVGSAAFTLTVTGAGFTRDSLVKFNYQPVATHYVSPTQLTATIPAALLTTHGRRSVMVTIPHVATSKGVGFDVTP